MLDNHDDAQGAGEDVKAKFIKGEELMLDPSAEKF